MVYKDLTFLSESRELNWFYKEYWYKGENPRFYTFHLAFNLMSTRTDRAIIVETGCQREYALGAGMSTSLFAKYCKRYGGHVYSVDISPTHVAASQKIIKDQELMDYVTLTVSDSLKYLPTAPSCDLLYLDSFDYPYGPLLEKYGGKTDIHAAEATLWKKNPDDLIKEFEEVITPCQTHCLNEFKAMEDKLPNHVVLLIDDCLLPGGGKGRLLHQYLQNTNQWVCLLDAYQSVWIRK